jgi:hypothetical protein
MIIVHVFHTTLVEVPSLVHVEHLPIEVPGGQEILPLQGRFELRGNLVEILLEAGPRQEAEHPA